MCQGSGTHQETAYDSVPDAIVQALPWRVYRSNRPQTWGEHNLAIGCLVSVTDYGRHKALDDDELVAMVKAADCRSYQAINGIVSRTDHNRVCTAVGIFTSDNGYTVRGIFEE